MHSYVLENVDQTHKKQHRSYVERKGKQEFAGFQEGKTMVKMRKLGKRRALLVNWEGLYTFMKYKDKKNYKFF